MNRPASSDIELTGPWLVVARAAWLGVTALTVGLFTVGLSFRYDELLTFCHGPGCDLVQLTAGEAGILQRWGLSVPAYALFFLVLEAVFALSYALIGLLIFWRKPGQWLSIFVSLTLVTFGAIIPPPLRTPQISASLLWLPVNLIQVLGWGLFFSFFYLFPDGRFVPRRTRARPLFFLICALAWFVVPGANVFTWPLPLALLLMLVFSTSGVAAQIYRYVRISTPAQRQQTKWVVFGFMAATLGIVLFLVPSFLFPALRQPGAARLIYHLVGVPFFALGFILIPATIGVSILRYRLWDIDIIINRTLVYGILTAALIGLYFASVILLQGLFRAITGERSQLAIVGSTLAIAALFNPLRRWVQDVIDWRFYRRKYDAALALAAFSAVARNETDMDSLTLRLAQVIDETVQPEHVSFWLRPGGKKVDEN